MGKDLHDHLGQHVVGLREVGQQELASHAEVGAGARDDEHGDGRIYGPQPGTAGVLSRDAAGKAVHGREERQYRGKGERDYRRPAPAAEVKVTLGQVRLERQAFGCESARGHGHRDDDYAQDKQQHLDNVGVGNGQQAARGYIEDDDHRGYNIAHAQTPSGQYVQYRGARDELSRRVAHHREYRGDAAHDAVLGVIPAAYQLGEGNIVKHTADALYRLCHHEGEGYAAGRYGRDVPHRRYAHAVAV